MATVREGPLGTFSRRRGPRREMNVHACLWVPMRVRAHLWVGC